MNVNTAAQLLRQFGLPTNIINHGLFGGILGNDWRVDKPVYKSAFRIFPYGKFWYVVAPIAYPDVEKHFIVLDDAVNWVKEKFKPLLKIEESKHQD